MPYEVHRVASRAPQRKNNTISVVKNGFRFNADFVERENLAAHKGVKLFFDRDRMRIAFKFYKNYNSKDGHEIRRLRLRNNGLFLKLSSFYKVYELDVDEIVSQYIPIKNENSPLGKIYEIELPKQ